MAETLNYLIVNSPLGPLRLVSDSKALLRIEFAGSHGDDGKSGKDPVLQQAAAELAEYFAGERQEFNIPLGAVGTEFQNRVWAALREIPYGQLRSYADIAEQLGNPRAVRAVGAANGRNPLPIVVPCHRVIGSDGSLTGFAGGLGMKEQLLQLEGATLDWR